MPWSVRPVPSAGQTVIQPVQVDISCYTPDFYGEACANDDEEHETALELINKYLWPEFLKLSQNKELQKIYKEYLIGFSLQHPNPMTERHGEYSRCYLEPFYNIPQDAPRFCETRFYHGPALAAAMIADFLSEYGHFVNLVPNYFASPHVKKAIDCVNKATATMPGLKRAILPLLEKLDRRAVPDIVHQAYALVERSMEDTLAAVETLAINTLTSEPKSQDVVAAIYTVYTLRSAAPCLTSALGDLTDMKKQETILWAQLATGGAVLVCAGITAVALIPAAAPAAAIATAEAATVGAATRSVVATATSSASVTTAATTASITGRGLGTFASVLGGGTCAFGGTASVYAAAELADVKKTEIINKTINEKVEHIIYYLALCFMRSSGIPDPREQTRDLNDALANLGGKRPPRNVQVYSAIHLHKLVREITEDFKKVHQTLVEKVNRRLQELSFTPKEFQEGACTFKF